MELSVVTVPLAEELDEVFTQEIVKQLNMIGGGVRTVELGADRCSILLHCEAGTSGSVIDSAKAIIARLTRGFARCQRSVRFSHTAPITTAVDPHPALLESKALVPIAPGVFAYNGVVHHLMERVDSYLRRKAVEKMCAECLFPTLLPVDLLKKIGYLDHFPQHAVFAAPFAGGLERLRETKGELCCGGSELRAVIARHLSAPALVLAPATCHFFYLQFENRTLAPEETILASAVTLCARQEHVRELNLTRLCQFRMREMMFLGSAAAAEKMIAEMEEVARNCVQELGISATYEAAFDPFFVDLQANTVPFQMSQGTKFELRAALPYNASTLAIASVNYHRDHFAAALNIKLADGSPAHSCCIGFGLERWALTIMSQFGVDPAKWPAPLHG